MRSAGTESVNASIFDLVRGRRSIRSFSSRSVPAQLIADLLEAVLWAPSPHNSQPWRFTVLLRDQEKARLADSMAVQLATELRVDGMDEESIRHQTERSRTRISSAPAVILCSLTADGLARFADERRNGLEWQMAVQSVGAVLQTLFLLAAERGLATCWMAAPMYCPEVVREALNLRDAFVPQALVLTGWPDGAGKERPRRAFQEVVEIR